MNIKIKEGGKAPDFCLQDGEDNKVCLNDFKGKKVVLYFYPKDLTPGCTVEAVDFSTLKSEFENEGVVILGASKDSSSSHKKFTEKKDLKIVLLSDESTKMQQEYGVWRKKKFMGKEYDGTVRTTVLIDGKGVIEKIWDAVRVKEHASIVLELMRS